jgi:hypothetical protein
LPEDEVIPAYPNGPTKETIIPNSPWRTSDLFELF